MKEPIFTVTQEEIDRVCADPKAKQLPVPAELLNLVMLTGTPDNIIRVAHPDGTGETWIERECAGRLRLLLEELERQQEDTCFVNPDGSALEVAKTERKFYEK